MSEREKFEAWAGQQGWSLQRRVDNGVYLIGFVERQWLAWQAAKAEAAEEREKPQAEIKRLQEIIRRAPCSQDSIPCRWPCGNDPSEHGPCWKQEALVQRAEREKEG